MTPERRQELTVALRNLATEMAAGLREQMLADGDVRRQALALHADEQVSDDFEVWTDLLSRRAAVLWVLKSVYVRVLEDRGLVDLKRIGDREGQYLFESLAPHLGETSYLRWVYRDLAQARGGMPDLFAPQPAELGVVDHGLSRKLIELWRRIDPETGELRYRFDEERFDGQFMGDLYQDLDPVVKDRYALLQTPDFVRDFILDQTLTPAIEEWGVENVRVLDPSCGSGHFLLEAFRRLVEMMKEKRPECSPAAIVKNALDRVVGIDINDYACGLARARLVLMAMELAEQPYMKAANYYHPHVYWADGLEQVEAEQQIQLQLGPDLDVAARRATMTRPEVREALRDVLRPGFHVVVGNPPYITEKDKERKKYHREKVGKKKERRYLSAYREYSLASPFTERCFQLATPNGYVGLITSNNFMKREFGKALIENVLAKQTLFKVVDTAGAHIPGHGTPTVLLFGRRATTAGSGGDTVTVVMGKRGEPSIPEDASKGLVWSSIVEGHDTVGHETEFTSTASVVRKALSFHPWSLGGGGASELKVFLDNRGPGELSTKADSIGFMCITKQDDVFVQAEDLIRRSRIERQYTRVFGIGERVRNWALERCDRVLFPYSAEIEPADLIEIPEIARFLWRFREVLYSRAVFGGSSFRGIGRAWWEYGQVPKSKFDRARVLSFAFVMTTNSFILSEIDDCIFNRTAPIITLGPAATEDDHLSLLGLLNSATGCFWMKQVFHCKGLRGQGGGITAESWEQFYEFDGTKIKAFPVASSSEQTPYARRLHEIARLRVRESVEAILNDETWTDAEDLRRHLDLRRQNDTKHLLRMVGLQEELDWLCYRLYGIDENVEVLPADAVPPLTPGVRPFEITLARDDVERRAMLERGATPSESPTAWFKRHRWQPRTEIPDDVDERYAALIRDRIERTKNSKNLRLVEQPNHKRRWYNPDYEAEEKAALREWLADRLEDLVETDGGLLTAQDAAGLAAEDRRLLAAGELYLGETLHNLEGLFTTLLDEESVPSHPRHRYTPNGLMKRAVWERTWELQRLEDATEDEEERRKIQPPVPPKYTQADFLKPRYYKLRGKLDVPKERFVAYTEVPRGESGLVLYGWAGWTPKERAHKLLVFDENLEENGIPLEVRIGLLDTVQRLLPEVEREDAAEVRDLRIEVRQVLGEEDPESRLEQWLRHNPPPGRKGRKKR